jgi:hypothetical protein
MKILLDWILTEGNYSRYRGKNNDGTRKVEFANEIARLMNENTKSVRTGKSVICKIANIEERFRLAYVYANSTTGQGVLAEHGEITFEDSVKRRCPYYFELLPIMADRSGTEPRIINTNPSALESSTDDNDLEEHSNINENYDEKENNRGNNDDGTTLVNETDFSDDNQEFTEQSRSDGTKSDGTKEKEKKRVPNRVTTPATGSKRRKTNNNQSLIDPNAISFLGTSTASCEKRMDETVRHHKELEKLEGQRVLWTAKSDEFKYKLQLFQEFENLRKKGMTKNKIVRLFPQMHEIAQTLESDDESSVNPKTLNSNE